MKREILSATETVTLNNINDKYAELSSMIEAYVLQFTKKTVGQQSTGDSSIEFTDICAAKALLFPEILPGTFDMDDFQLKKGSMKDIRNLQLKLIELINKLDAPLKICKTDAKYYSNKFYSLIQQEANNSAKYLPTLNELTVFYKKTRHDKTDPTKPVNPAEN